MPKTVQEIQFELIKRASFNNFNGKQIVKDLQKNKKLWKGVIMAREAYSKPINLINLRDIQKNTWNVDTLYILSNKKNDRKLEQLTDT